MLPAHVGCGVRLVSARLVNDAKTENLEKVESSSMLKHKAFLTTRLTQDTKLPGKWTGELSIPSSWMEGGTKTYERTGQQAPTMKRPSTSLG